MTTPQTVPLSAERLEEIERTVGLTICETWSDRGVTVEGRISAKDFTDLIASHQHLEAQLAKLTGRTPR